MRVFKLKYKFKVNTIHDIKHSSIWIFLNDYDNSPFYGIFSYEDTLYEYDDLNQDDRWYKLTANLQLGVLL